MEWLEEFRGKSVGLDTAPLIYFIEENLSYLPIVKPFFEAVEGGDFAVITSTLTLAEVLVHPMRRGDHELADHYRNVLLHANHVTMVGVSGTIAETASQLRAQYGLRTPDAIQLATANRCGASFFFPTTPDFLLSFHSRRLS
jgi:predicted nucleic acid-binding protein